ncbi:MULTISPECIES: hypothetical protein [unclassified Mucilaginibacter]|uniref:hypothetical protein n=1 Tax=unclassified Mucilaginibacter TaxID=2617802 RepID=UPI002AC96005|nr:MULTISPECIES: hypothetical protein [unclassified Mucilaginibacter]MEB0261397.1 hypothetical protein [Mucilaginibacter sp. 10I4]MEB0278844.1 hypothetical protein [Mucilaginibacter sp. 10B2]MEB0299790.1 hypothetical protein [Mucilaginibacter sp. 5C4]WPX22027.1 hypothetical protein RHM67_12125 [Mucilaginibacter sp. 5C4]
MKGKQDITDAELLDTKANELVALLKTGAINADHAKIIQQKINKALKKYDNLPSNLQNDLELLLSAHQLQKATIKDRFDFETIKKYLLGIIGAVMITLGMAMIIMPAPPYFEMFTIYHFNANDGVTLMDLIALVIVFTGVYLFFSALSKKASV